MIHEMKREPLSPRTDNTPVKQSYTLGICWDSMTSKVQVRALRDCLQLQMTCQASGVDFYVAALATELHPFLQAARINVSANPQAATYWRVYVNDKHAEVALPEGHKTVDRIFVGDPDVDMRQRLRYDPEFHTPVSYTDRVDIPSTIPWNPPPNKGGNLFQTDF